VGAGHPSVGSTLHNLASLYLAQKSYGDAARACASALAHKEAALGRLHPEYAASLAQLAEVFRLQGRFQDAVALLRESSEVLDAIGAGHSRAAASRLSRLAYVLSEAGSQGEAVTVHRRLLHAAEAEGGQEAPVALAQALAGLAEALCCTAEGHAEARDLCRRGLALAQPVLGDLHPFSAALMRRLADALLGAGGEKELDEAEALLRAAGPVLERTARERPASDAAQFEWAAVLVASAALQARRGAVDAVFAARALCDRLPTSFGREVLHARLAALMKLD